MRNNWQKQSRSEQIERLEMITNHTMLAKTLQETKAKVILRNRHKRLTNSISSIVKRLHRIDQKNQLTSNKHHYRHNRVTIPKLQKLRHAHAKIKRSRAKLLTKLKNRVRTNELELWSRARLAKTASIDGTDTATEVTIETQEEMDKLAHELFPQKSVQPKDRYP